MDSTSELIAKAQSGDQEAVGKLLEQYRHYLLVVANAQIDPDLQAKGGGSDLVQETFMEACRDFPRFQGSTEQDLLGWLQRILANNAEDFRRAYRQTAARDLKREKRVSDSNNLEKLPGDGETPSAEFRDREKAELLERAMARLSEEYRLVIEMRNRDHMRFAEIGERLGRSADAVRMLWQRAVERLQEELNRGEGG